MTKRVAPFCSFYDINERKWLRRPYRCFPDVFICITSTWKQTLLLNSTAWLSGWHMPCFLVPISISGKVSDYQWNYKPVMCCRESAVWRCGRDAWWMLITRHLSPTTLISLCHIKVLRPTQHRHYAHTGQLPPTLAQFSFLNEAWKCLTVFLFSFCLLHTSSSFFGFR